MHISTEQQAFLCENTLMNWDDLRYFLALARTGKLIGAGAMLDVDHTTVRRRIMTLPGVGDVEANVLLSEELRPGPLAALAQ